MTIVFVCQLVMIMGCPPKRPVLAWRMRTTSPSPRTGGRRLWSLTNERTVRPWVPDGASRRRSSSSLKVSMWSPVRVVVGVWRSTTTPMMLTKLPGGVR
ncbi:hypothetical protein Tdes44962_MAKER09996 [Teratosphaeria destructans]|uniref:Uncharacterized protein n=1 Tax=Teratosphaeria destructans TaxID=418781 RepID=A0A9W7SQB8_9PEZI|nr:hypothetical protein Tdes44962_MAKER09996 [Teratosphaeria destructans]